MITVGGNTVEVESFLQEMIDSCDLVIHTDANCYHKGWGRIRWRGDVDNPVLEQEHLFEIYPVFDKKENLNIGLSAFVWTLVERTP